MACWYPKIKSTKIFGQRKFTTTLQSLCNVLYLLVAKRANTISTIFEVNVLRQILL